jgi:predicted N-acyltransferase
LTQRIGTQFHWTNEGFASFDDFLAKMSSRKRKQIKRERRDAAAQGLTVRALQGAEITPAIWRRFHDFYRNTTDRKWGSAYLHGRFWGLLGQRLGERVVLMLAERDGEAVAGALNLWGEDALYGRNWGSTVEVLSLLVRVRPAPAVWLCRRRKRHHLIRDLLRRFESARAAGS